MISITVGITIFKELFTMAYIYIHPRQLILFLGTDWGGCPDTRHFVSVFL